MKSILIILLLLSCLSPVYGQPKKKKTAKKPIIHEWGFSKLPYDAELVANINQLQYDSVRIYSFGCPPSITAKLKDRLYMDVADADILEMGLVDANQHWLPALSDAGQIFKQQDVVKALELFKNQHLDKYYDDPVGCFEPHMGIVFYKGPLVNAHMDVCLACGKINFEKFADGKTVYENQLGVLGQKIRKFFESLVPKYKLVTCR